MGNDRNDIIKRAIMDKLGSGFNVYTADEILIVAGVDDSQIAKLTEIIDAKAAQISRKIPTFNKNDYTIP